MKKYIDQAFTFCFELSHGFDNSWSEDRSLLFDWNPLIVSLYLSVCESLREQYESTKALVDALKDFLRTYYVVDIGDQVKITGYAIDTDFRLISCFSMYNLMRYSLIQNEYTKKMFYRVMLEYPFCYRCITGDTLEENEKTVFDSLGISLKLNDVMSASMAELKNSKKIKSLIEYFMDKQEIRRMPFEMEIAEQETAVIEAYFSFSEGEKVDEFSEYLENR